MKNKIMLLVAFVLMGVQASYALTESVFNSSATGTTSATAFVPVGEPIGMVSDLSYRLDSTVTTGFIGEYVGARQYLITSSTASAASVLWFDNSGGGVAAGSFVIFLDHNTQTYFLRRVSTAATTSCTLYASIAVTTTTQDRLWLCSTAVERAVVASNSSTGGVAQLWIPASMPAAIVIDGNTTSCRISISGFRGARN